MGIRLGSIGGLWLLSCSLFAVADAQTLSPVVLVTEEEAQEPPPADIGSLPRGITRGPVIEDVAPGDGEAGYVVPGPFQFRFLTRNGVPIDPDTVHVVYLRSRPIDITARVRPFISKSEINVPAAVVPSGFHAFRIEAADGLGRKSSLVVRFTAAERPRQGH